MVARAPRKRMYRTMQGRMVDIEKLRAANESVRAVGNMNVNARGDVLGPNNTVVSTKSQQIQQYYEAPRGKVDDTPARSKPTPARKTPSQQPTVKQMTPMPEAPQPIITKQEPVAQPKKVVVDPAPAKTVETFKPKTNTEKKGIDAALDGLE